MNEILKWIFLSACTFKDGCPCVHALNSFILWFEFNLFLCVLRILPNVNRSVHRILVSDDVTSSVSVMNYVITLKKMLNLFTVVLNKLD